MGKEKNNLNESEKGEKFRFAKGFIKSILRRKLLEHSIISEIRKVQYVLK